MHAPEPEAFDRRGPDSGNPGALGSCYASSLAAGGLPRDCGEASLDSVSDEQ